MNEKQSRAGFPAWAAPGIGLVVGTFLAYTTLLQNEPLSPLPPLTTLALGAGIGCAAGGLVGLGECLRR
ncbi:hypothetical protein [Bythopirellula polymerisocia]|uniref:Uncharacterized protein n=1 Tax=Bythopirellula polymerisocia TaxID=2528003 RepID=A0A5C6D4H1_9BACT|nr:hypothetical protein [Bythopirellula polymerisocia]TWU30146.1 hypothetical protein Pla144_09320 [Bythopirellula polymerisocia]